MVIGCSKGMVLYNTVIIEQRKSDRRVLYIVCVYVFSKNTCSPKDPVQKSLSVTVEPSSPPQPPQPHLLRSQHNYLRITRILKSLGELGYEAFKAPLVRLFLEESLCHNTLPNMQHSILEYFVYTIRLPATRRRLLRFARQHYRPAHAFLWGPPPKRRGGGSGGGGSVGAGSSGIRAPAPTPEPQRRAEGESPTSPCGGIIVSSHSATLCQELAGGSLKGVTGLEGPPPLMMVDIRGERKEYGEMNEKNHY